MAKLNIQDSSGDKEFFTMLPNFILNHSTANDQSLYAQMKKYAGENGRCFATEKTLMEKMKIGKKAFDKSLNYLLEKKWIEFIGITEGKTRPIKTYKVNNIWQENSDYYKKISVESTLSQKDKFQKEGDKFQKQHKISVESSVSSIYEQDLYKQEQKEDISISEIKISHKRKDQDIFDLIELFKSINPSYKRFFSNITQRSALQRLLQELGREKLERAIKFIPQIAGKDYAPTITTPCELENKLAALIIFIKKEKNKFSEPIKV